MAQVGVKRLQLANLTAMLRRILVIALLVAACGPSDADSSSTSSTSATSSTLASTTTSEALTTTTEQSTTTTTEATTTTTTLPPTTTTTQLQGNWAGQPLVIARMGAVGWWDGSQWVDAQDEGSLPVVGGENYQVARIGIEAVVLGEAPTTLCEPFVNNLGINIDQPDLLGEWPGPAGVAISAPWDLQPHLFQAFGDDGTYAAVASQLLANRGLNVPNPVIKQLFRTDLEGDGINEILVVAEDLTNGYLTTNGDYSIAFLQKVVQGEVATAILGSSVITDANNQYFIGFTIGAVADLNGDSKMEMVLDSADFEGFGVGVWEYANDDLGPILVFETGCGA